MINRKMIAMILAEFLATAILTVALYSIVVRTTFPLFTGLAMAATYGLLVAVFSGLTYLHANPAVTISMWVVRKVQTIQALAYIAAQLLGGLAAWALLKYFLGHNLDNMITGKFDWKVLIAEGTGTAIFMFGLAAAKYQDLSGNKLATVAAVSLLVGVIVAAMASNALLNPAIAAGIRSWDWSYAAGPIVGGVVGVGVYNFLFAPEATKSKGRAKK